MLPLAASFSQLAFSIVNLTLSLIKFLSSPLCHSHRLRTSHSLIKFYNRKAPLQWGLPPPHFSLDSESISQPVSQRVSIIVNTRLNTGLSARTTVDLRHFLLASPSLQSHLYNSCYRYTHTEKMNPYYKGSCPFYRHYKD